MTLFKWSQTAASNGTADSTCPFPEGMAPSAVNDGTRGMMAAVAKYRDDVAGAIVTAGTSTAYTVASYEGFDTLAHLNGQMIAFAPHVINGATVTLNVDGLGVKPLRTAPGIELLAGVLNQGTPYIATYSNADGAFYLHGFYGNPYNIPLGAGLDYWLPTAPNSSFVFPVGQAVSRTAYAALFSAMGTTYGAGDGSTTFNIPDLRGRLGVPADNMGGSQAFRINNILTNGLGSVGGEQQHLLVTGEIPSHVHGNTLTDSGHAHVQNSLTLDTSGGPGIYGSGGGSMGSHSLSTASATTGITINNVGAGGGGTHNNVQPSIVCNYIMRII